MKREWVILAVVVAVLLGFGAGILVKWPTGSVGGRSAEGGNPMIPRRGAEAPLVVVHELSDFQCPYCSKGALDVLVSVEKKYAGKVGIVFHNNPLPMHEMAVPAAKASLAAGLQGQYWQMHDWLFRNQKGLNLERIQGAARSLGLDMDRFGWDMADPRLDQAIKADQFVAQQMGLQGTPMFVINGQVVKGAQPIEEFSKIIDVELEKADAALKAGTPQEQLEEALSTANGAHPAFIKHWVKGEEVPLPGNTEKKKQLATP